MDTKPTNLSRRLWETERDTAANIQYWLEKFRTIDDGSLQITQTLVPDRQQTLALDAALGSNLLKMSNGKKEAFQLLLFVNFAILISKYTGQHKFILGAFDLGNPDDRSIVPVYLSLDAAMSFKDLVKAVRTQYLESLAHRAFPIASLLERLPAEERGRFFAGYYGIQYDDGISLPAVLMPPLFGVEENGVIKQLRLQHGADLNIDAHLFLHHFITIAGQTVADPQVIYKDIGLLDADQRKQVLSWGMGIGRKGPDDHILDAWMKRLREGADRMALEGADGSMTYKEFYDWTTGIGCFLHQEFGIGEKQVVAIRCDRGIWLVGLAFASLRLGSTFVGIDTRWPEERVSEVLRDSGAALLINHSKSTISCKQCRQWTITTPAKVFTFPGELPDLERDPADIAYMIYTSGTTGKPKGIPVSHASFMNMICAQTVAIDLGSPDRVLQFASLSFDASVYEIFMALLNGACLITLTNDIVDRPSEFGEFLLSRGVTMTLLPPVYLSQLRKDYLTGLRTLLVGGDFPVAGDMRQLASTGIRCYNAYGPAELAVIASTHPVLPDEDAPIPIGRPLDNTTWYILDRHLNPVPAGFRGELYIGGAGVGRGYHGLDELTAVKYIADPFGEGKLYRTGDSAYWREDGLAVLAGRMDDQVKVRGQLVEPREIQILLGNIPGIRDAVVYVDRENAAGAIIRAFYTVNDKIDAAWLIDRLRESLPYYMIPSSFEEVTEIPLTASGKPDKNALLDGLYRKAVNEKPVVARNQIEADMQEVWRDVLGKTIGLNDHFVGEGGDSIKVIQFCSRLKEKGYQISVRDVFTNPTIEELALRMKPSLQRAENSMVEGVIPLSPVQRVFCGLHFAEPWHFNQAAVLKLNDNWSPDSIRSVFSGLLSHHDALRISFDTSGNEYLQVNQAWPVPVEVNTYDYRERPDPVADIRATSAKNQGSLQLDKAPLLRLDYYLTQNGIFLGVIIHHLVVDAVSWGILLEDLDRSLKGQPAEVGLPDKTVSWKEWCEKLNEVAGQQRPFRGKATVRLPRMATEMENTVGNAARVVFSLDRMLTRQLDEDVHHRYRTTVQDFLLAAFAHAIFGLWEVDSISIDMETHGRQVINGLDAGRTIGWFTAFYPVYLEKAGRDGAGEDMIVEAKEAIRKGQALALQHTLFYAAKGMADGAAILFNYLGKTAARKFESFSWSGIVPGPTQSLTAQRMYDWEINALIRDGKLTVNLDYCPGHFQQDVMEKLMSAVGRNLTGLIQHFNGQRELLLTPSDLIFGNPGTEELLEWQKNRSLEDIYPLTPMQEGMYYHFLSERGAGFYSTQVGYTLKGGLRVEKFEKAYRILIKRHSGLRSLFVQDRSGKPWQLVLRDPHADFIVEDIRYLNGHEAQLYIRSAAEKEKQKGFDLSNDLLMRVRLFILDEREFHVIWSYHHIIMDGWCMSILISEWMNLYRRETDGPGGTIPPATPYRKYIAWLGKKDVEASYAWWLDLLKGYSGDTRIPDSGRSAAAIDRTARKSKGIQIDEQRTWAIRRLSADWNITLYVLMQGLWGLILSKYTQSSDLVFGSVVSGRPSDLEGVESMVGLFINNIPVRVRLYENEPFVDLLRRLQTQSVDAESHQYCSLAEIQSRIPGNPVLVEHILLFENYPHPDELGQPEYKTSGAESLRIAGSHVSDINNYAFTLVVLPGEKLRIRIDFNPQVHAEELIADILSCFDELFSRLEKNSEWKIAELGRLPDGLQKKLLNGGKAPTPASNELLSVTGQLEQSVARYGQHMAICSPDGEYTYDQLDERSRRLAYCLRTEYGVLPGEVVAIHMERSGLAFLGIMGILRSGAAYVPVDPGWPSERKEHILKDAGVKVVVSLFGHLPELAGLGCQVLALDMQTENGGETEQLPEDQHSPEDLAYLIYTSGSTGQSKGVKISHKSNVNMALDQIRQFGIGSEDNVLQFAPLFFDASVYEWSIAFYSGATLFIPDDRTIKNPELFRLYLESHDISMMTLPPTFFQPASVAGDEIAKGGSAGRVLARHRADRGSRRLIPLL